MPPTKSSSKSTKSSTSKPTSTLKTYNFRVGTTSEFIPLQHRPTIKDVNTHKWRLYLRGPPDSPDPSFLVKLFRVTLDESYAPNHEVSITSYPFHISRRGFSGFSIPVELHLWNGEVICFEHELSLKNDLDREVVEKETNVCVVVDESEVNEDLVKVAEEEALVQEALERASSEERETPHKVIGKRRKKTGSMRGKRKKKRVE